MICKENHTIDRKTTKHSWTQDNSKKIIDNFFRGESIKLFLLLKNRIAIINYFNYCNQHNFYKINRFLSKIIDNLHQNKVFWDSISLESIKSNSKINKTLEEIAKDVINFVETGKFYQVYNALDHAIFEITNIREIDSKNQIDLDLKVVSLLKEKANNLYRSFYPLVSNWNALEIIIAKYCSFSDRDLSYVEEEFLKSLSEKLEIFGDKLEDYIEFFDIETLQKIQLIMNDIIEQSRKKNIAFNTPSDSKNSWRIRIRNSTGFINRLIDFVIEESETEDREILEAIAHCNSFHFLEKENAREESVQN